MSILVADKEEDPSACVSHPFLFLAFEECGWHLDIHQDLHLGNIFDRPHREEVMPIGSPPALPPKASISMSAAAFPPSRAAAAACVSARMTNHSMMTEP